MDKHTIWNEVNAALIKSRKEKPNWPDHVCGQSGIVTEAAGKLMSTSLNIKYNKSYSEVIDEVEHEELKNRAINTAVAAIRFLENLK